MASVRVHPYTCTAKDWFVNTYLVETANGVVLIDGGLAVSSSHEIRAKISDELRKPLLAVLLTHGHPDHYVGVGEIVGTAQVPIVATERAREQARERDAVEAPVLARFFGDDFPAQRVLPNVVVADGAMQVYDGVQFRLQELGPCESESDSVWIVDGEDGTHYFVGDLLYNHVHAFFMDGYALQWLEQLDRMLQQCDHRATLYPGHGDLAGIEALAWQRGYIEAFLVLLRRLVGPDATLTDDSMRVLVERMTAFVGNERLLYLLTFGMDRTVRLLTERGAI